MQENIRQVIETALRTLGIDDVAFSVEHPADRSHGDYATNVAMVAAKKSGTNPRTCAEEIVQVIEKNKPGVVATIEIAGPGFINFYLARTFFTNQVVHAQKEGERWGHNDTWKGKTVVVEYTSPNLFKPLHIGNLVGNIIGESLARLFIASGAVVKRFNYPSDIGLTVAKGVWGLQHTDNDPEDISVLGEAYRKGNEAYEKGGREAKEIEAVNTALYEGNDPELNALREKGIATSKKQLTELLAQLGTNFDYEITESMSSTPGTAIVKEHTGDVFEESEGAVVYRGEKVGLHTRVFLNSKGLPTYEAKDIGHFKLKHEAEPQWDLSIIVTGNEQSEYFKVVFAAIQEVFPEAADRSLEHVPTGFLTLTTGKMSSRKGDVLTGESLLQEMEDAASERSKEHDAPIQDVAVAALKYQILKHSVGSNIVFDKEKALSFEGDSGPYLQYTHARACSVLEKAKEEGVHSSADHAPEIPYDLERILYQFPEVIVRATEGREPHHLVTYLTELAGTFNTFYAKERIADTNDEYAPYKAVLTAAVRATLAQGLWCLGIKAPTRM